MTATTAIIFIAIIFLCFVIGYVFSVYDNDLQEPYFGIGQYFLKKEKNQQPYQGLGPMYETGYPDTLPKGCNKMLVDVDKDYDFINLL
jgi:hypothetical protein